MGRATPDLRSVLNLNLNLLTNRQNLSGNSGLQLLIQQAELGEPVLLLGGRGGVLLQAEALLHQLGSLRDPGSYQRNTLLLTTGVYYDGEIKN